MGSFIVGVVVGIAISICTAAFIVDAAERKEIARVKQNISVIGDSYHE